MPFRIPIPKRSLRSLAVLALLVLAPYLILRHLSSIPDNNGNPSLSTTTDRLSGLLQQPLMGRAEINGHHGGVASGSRSHAAKAPTTNKDNARQPADSSSTKSNAKSQSGAERLLIQDKAGDSWLRIGSESGIDNSKSKSKSSSISGEEHEYLANGLLIPNIHGQHPIYDLLSRAREAWQDKIDRQSKTLAQAVDTYRKRYGRAPPKGFDRWWDWAQKNHIQLPDEYDQIHNDLEPFWAFTPTELKALRSEAAAKKDMYVLSCPGPKRPRGASAECTYTFTETGLNPGHKKVLLERVEAQKSLLKGIEDQLEEVDVVFYSHDVPWQFVGHDYKSALEDSAALGEYINMEDYQIDQAHLGWASACAPHKPLRQSYDVTKYPDLEKLWQTEKSFVWDHKAAMDPCTHPTIVHLAGFLSGHGKGPGPEKKLFPVLAMCKTPLHSDVLAVAEEAWTEDVGIDPVWEDKEESRMMWRGKNTGIYFKDSVPWNISQRINLVQHTSQTTGKVPVFQVVPPNAPVGQPQPQSWAELNAELVDVGFTNEPIQCDPAVCEHIKKTYKYVGRKDWQQANQYKYLLDIDGNGWSARFKRLMTTNSAILKSTIFPEWYTDRIQPWVHYIPLKADLTDLYDVLTFFREHDHIGKEIGQNGKEWSKTFWRKEDMTSYQFRMFLEMARLMATDRDEASYKLRGQDIIEQGARDRSNR